MSDIELAKNLLIKLTDGMHPHDWKFRGVLFDVFDRDDLLRLAMFAVSETRKAEERYSEAMRIL